MTKKTGAVLLIFFLTALAAPFAVYAITAGSTLTDRIDFTMGGSDASQVTANTINASADVAGKAAEAPPKAAAYNPDLVGISYFEVDLMSIARSVTEGAVDINCRTGWGNYGNMGWAVAFDIYGIYRYEALVMQGTVDFSLDIYPFGKAPAGWYISPMLGIGMAGYSNILEHPDGGFAILPIGIETGYRLNLGGFLADMSVEYTFNYCFTQDFIPNTYSDYTFRIGTGWYFGDYQPRDVTGTAAAQKPADGGKNEK